METGLNLQQAETMVRQRAAVQEQQYALKHPADTKLQMDSVRRSHTFRSLQKESRDDYLLRHKVYLQSAEDVVKTLILFSNVLPEMLHAIQLWYDRFIHRK